MIAITKKEKFIQYIHRTWKNKVYAILFLVIGMIPVILDSDGTALVFFGIIAVGLLFSNENWVV